MDNSWNAASGIKDVCGGQAFEAGVRLFVFTPRIHGSVGLRPMVYNLDDQVASDILRVVDTDGMNIKQAFGHAEMPSLTRAILPNSHPIMVDTRHYDEMWSFVLVFDALPAAMSHINIGGPKSRNLLTGYFIDEPINPMTMGGSSPTPNLNACMIFTRQAMVTISEHMSQRSQHQLGVGANATFVPPIAAAHVPTEDLMLTDLQSIAKCSVVEDASSKMVDHGSAYVGTRSHAAKISGIAGTARQQLQNLTSVVGQSTEQVRDPDVFRTMDSSIGIDPFDMFATMMYQQMGTEYNGGIQNGLDPTVGIPLHWLDTHFPNLHMIPCRIPSTPSYETGDQSEISPTNSMSALASSSIASYAVEAGLSGIAFEYMSTRGEFGMSAGAWQLHKATPLLGPAMPEAQLKANVNWFKMSLETDLFPVLKSFNGEFSIRVDYDVAGCGVIDLHFLDESPESRGFYETHSRLGGIISPSVGSETTFNHNSSQFDALVNTLNAQVVGAVPVMGGGHITPSLPQHERLFE